MISLFYSKKAEEGFLLSLVMNGALILGIIILIAYLAGLGNFFTFFNKEPLSQHDVPPEILVHLIKEKLINEDFEDFLSFTTNLDNDEFIFFFSEGKEPISLTLKNNKTDGFFFKKPFNCGSNPCICYSKIDFYDLILNKNEDYFSLMNPKKEFELNVDAESCSLLPKGIYFLNNRGYYSDSNFTNFKNNMTKNLNFFSKENKEERIPVSLEMRSIFEYEKELKINTQDYFFKSFYNDRQDDSLLKFELQKQVWNGGYLIGDFGSHPSGSISSGYDSGMMNLLIFPDISVFNLNSNIVKFYNVEIVNVPTPIKEVIEVDRINEYDKFIMSSFSPLFMTMQEKKLNELIFNNINFAFNEIKLNEGTSELKSNMFSSKGNIGFKSNFDFKIWSIFKNAFFQNIYGELYEVYIKNDYADSNFNIRYNGLETKFKSDLVFRVCVFNEELSKFDCEKKDVCIKSFGKVENNHYLIGCNDEYFKIDLQQENLDINLIKLDENQKPKCFSCILDCEGILSIKGFLSKDDLKFKEFNEIKLLPMFNGENIIENLNSYRLNVFEINNPESCILNSCSYDENCLNTEIILNKQYSFDTTISLN